MAPSISKKLAGLLSRSPLCASGRRLWERNQQDWAMPLSKWQKLSTGLFLILADHEIGLFPPVFNDQAATHAAEVTRASEVPGLDAAGILDAELRKPYWPDVRTTRRYLHEYSRILECLLSKDVRPPARLLELGCGFGWTAELLATTGYAVTGTSIAPAEIQGARRRIKSLQARGINAQLDFAVASMETVAEQAGLGQYDAVYVYEALHHAFDWRQAIRSCHASLKPGGWLFLCHEPNLVHTFSSYRVARLGNMHEIGFSRHELLDGLVQAGFGSIDYRTPRLHFWIKPHWICARKTK